MLLTLAAIYATGIVVNSLLGKYLLKRLIDAIIMRLPGIRFLYQGWKQIALTPGGTEGTFSKVVLIPDETGTMRLIGFCSGRLIEAVDEPSYCVFIPSSPNPITGRLYFIRASRCQFIQMSTEEAFKVILSTGQLCPANRGRRIPRARNVKSPQLRQKSRIAILWPSEATQNLHSPTRSSCIDRAIWYSPQRIGILTRDATWR